MADGCRGIRGDDCEKRGGSLCAVDHQRTNRLQLPRTPMSKSGSAAPRDYCRSLRTVSTKSESKSSSRYGSSAIQSVATSVDIEMNIHQIIRMQRTNQSTYYFRAVAVKSQQPTRINVNHTVPSSARSTSCPQQRITPSCSSLHRCPSPSSSLVTIPRHWPVSIPQSSMPDPVTFLCSPHCIPRSPGRGTSCT